MTKSLINGGDLGTTTRSSRVDARILESLGVDMAEFSRMSESEKAYTLQCLDEMAETGKSITADSLVAADYRWQPVSCEQFLEDPYYLGDMTRDMFPACRSALIETFDGKVPPVEVILGGAIGWGKTTMATAGMLYDLYRIGCLVNPHAFHGIMPGAPITFAFYSTSKEQSADSAFGKLVNWVEGSPYFKEKMPKVGKHTTRAKFAGAPVLVITGSQEVHAIGKDVYCFLLDEANFLQSKNGGAEDQGRAYGIYNNARDRLKSRFMDNHGEIPGKVWLISSKRTHASFLESHIAKSKKDISEGKTRLYQYSQWAVRDPKKYTEPKFRVEVGDRMHPSKILQAHEDPRIGADVITVPGEFLGNFEQDMDGALRNIAGVATENMCPLIQDKRALMECIDKDNLFHPFTMPEISITTEDDVQIASFFEPSIMFKVVLSKYVPRYNPTAPRFVHVDVAFTGDSMGIACCHQSGFKIVKRARPDGTFYDDRVPMVTLDFMLRIRPPKRGGEIDLAKMRAFLISLRDMGLPIWRVTLDGHQGRDTMQVLRHLDFDAVLYSVDKTDEAYMTLKQAVMEKRVQYYEYPTFLREMRELERDIEEGKVDHPQVSPETGERGSKDVSDAVAGCVFNAMIDLKAPGAEVSSPESQDNMDSKFKSTQGEVAWEVLDREAK